jgi:hypothetical protein
MQPRSLVEVVEEAVEEAMEEAVEEAVGRWLNHHSAEVADAIGFQRNLDLSWWLEVCLHLKNESKHHPKPTFTQRTDSSVPPQGTLGVGPFNALEETKG